ncbi:MAG: stage II sporulation protein P [Bacillota bacterium]|nr:stage II sporulation protein P [Bacillota bacterium]
MGPGKTPEVMRKEFKSASFPLWFLLWGVFFLLALPARGAEPLAPHRILYEEGTGRVLLRTHFPLFPGDEYLAPDGSWYVVVKTIGWRAEGRRRKSIPSPAFEGGLEPGEASPLGHPPARVIGIIHTHSAESYRSPAGSPPQRRGEIFRVGEVMAKEFALHGLRPIHSWAVYSADGEAAYYQSRRTLIALRKYPLSLVLDVHCETAPRAELSLRERGRHRAQIRLVVGRGSQGERALGLALRLIEVARRERPGLIRDLLVTKAIVNQDLHPALLTVVVGSNQEELALAGEAARELAALISSALEATPELGTLPPAAGRADLAGSERGGRLLWPWAGVAGLVLAALFLLYLTRA